MQFPLMYKCWGFEIKRQINRTTATPHQIEVGAEIVDNIVTVRAYFTIGACALHTVSPRNDYLRPLAGIRFQQ